MTSLLTFIISTHLSYAGNTASSQLSKDNNKFPSSAAFDGLLETSWAEGEPGQGEGTWLELNLGRSTQIDTLHIWPGKLDEGLRSFQYNARPRSITVTLDGVPLEETFYIEDKMSRVDLKIDAKAKKIRIQIEQAYEGRVFSELHIAEMAINYMDDAPVSKIRAWQKTREATRMDEAFREDVEANYSQYKSAEFGDKDALSFIGKAAGDGPVYLQKKVRSIVGDGYRAQAIQSHPYAREALRKLKDPNAIPFLERAMLRSTGSQYQQIKGTISYFRAYQEMVGGPNRNPQNWGDTGWSVGELQSFGEPLPIEVDRFGSLYLADIGNNRIQLFNDEGRSIKQWGAPEPGITNSWYSEKGDYYVSGSDATSENAQFINPLDVVLIPEKEADGFATLEANGRIQVFDSNGTAILSWIFNHNYPAESALGGTGYLAYLPKHDYLCPVIQDQGACFDRVSGEQIGETWDVPDGTPNALEVLTNDTLLLVFGNKIIGYAFDGFRKKVLIDEDIIGRGFESLDITIDEKGKLWVLTDMGDLYKFKRPGKLDYKLKIIDRPINYPRLALIEDMVFITSDDRIEVIDVRQRIIDLEDQSAEE